MNAAFWNERRILELTPYLGMKAIFWNERRNMKFEIKILQGVQCSVRRNVVSCKHLLKQELLADFTLHARKMTTYGLS